MIGIFTVFLLVISAVFINFISPDSASAQQVYYPSLSPPQGEEYYQPAQPVNYQPQQAQPQQAQPQQMQAVPPQQVPVQIMQPQYAVPVQQQMQPQQIPVQINQVPAMVAPAAPLNIPAPMPAEDNDAFYEKMYTQ